MDSPTLSTSKLMSEGERYEYERVKKAKKEREETLHQIHNEKRNNPESYMYGIPKKYLSYSFDSFDGGEGVKKICNDFIKKYERNTDGLTDFGLVNYPGSLLFTGQPGCGKTHIAISIYRELIQQGKDGWTNFITVPEFLLKIRNSFNLRDREDDNETEEQIIKEYATVELLLLDDLGTEKTSEFTIQSLYLLLDRRNRELRPTIITTNLSLQEIEEKLDARIASRLSEMKIIKMNMPDYRKKRTTSTVKQIL